MLKHRPDSPSTRKTDFAWPTLDTLAQHHTSPKNGRKVMVLRFPKF